MNNSNVEKRKKISILVADDHALLRLGLKHQLSELGPGIEVVEAGSLEEIALVAREKPDLSLILLDLRMPDGDGFEALKLLRSLNPDVPVVVLTASDNPDDMHRALSLGAKGYISKGEPPQVMINALRLVLSGSVYIPPRMLDVPQFASTSKTALEAGSLTPRQQEILRLIVLGKSNKEIAREFSLAESTVKVHVSAIFRFLNVSNRTKAAFVARQRGLDKEAGVGLEPQESNNPSEQ